MDPARGLLNESPPKRRKESPLNKIHEGLNESPLKYLLKNNKINDFCVKGVPPAAENHVFLDFGLKGVPPAAKNHDFSDFGLKGGPPAAKNNVFAVFGNNIDILSGSEVFFFSPPLSGSKIKKYIKF